MYSNHHDDHHHERGTISVNPRRLKGVDINGRVITKKKTDADRLHEYKISVARTRQEALKK